MPILILGTCWRTSYCWGLSYAITLHLYAMGLFSVQLVSCPFLILATSCRTPYRRGLSYAITLHCMQWVCSLCNEYYVPVFNFSNKLPGSLSSRCSWRSVADASVAPKAIQIETATRARKSRSRTNATLSTSDMKFGIPYQRPSCLPKTTSQHQVSMLWCSQCSQCF